MEKKMVNGGEKVDQQYTTISDLRNAMSFKVDRFILCCVHIAIIISLTAVRKVEFP